MDESLSLSSDSDSESESESESVPSASLRAFFSARVALSSSRGPLSPFHSPRRLDTLRAQPCGRAPSTSHAILLWWLLFLFLRRSIDLTGWISWTYMKCGTPGLRNLLARSGHPFSPARVALYPPPVSCLGSCLYCPSSRGAAR